jgi:hypothetical protein
MCGLGCRECSLGREWLDKAPEETKPGGRADPSEEGPSEEGLHIVEIGTGGGTTSGFLASLLPDVLSLPGSLPNRRVRIDAF